MVRAPTHWHRHQLFAHSLRRTTSTAAHLLDDAAHQNGILVRVRLYNACAADVPGNVHFTGCTLFGSSKPQWNECFTL
jgi:hypothetical protein